MALFTSPRALSYSSLFETYAPTHLSPHPLSNEKENTKNIKTQKSHLQISFGMAACAQHGDYSRVKVPLRCRLPATVPATLLGTMVAVCGVVPVAATVPLFPAGTYRLYRVTTTVLKRNSQLFSGVTTRVENRDFDVHTLTPHDSSKWA